MNNYGETKWIEELFVELAQEAGVRPVRTRYGNVCGGDRYNTWPPQHLVQIIVAAGLRLCPFGVTCAGYPMNPGNPDNTPRRDFVNVNYLGRATQIILQRLEFGQKVPGVINLRTEKGSSVYEVVTAGEQFFQTTFTKTQEGVRSDEDPVLKFSTEQARRKLGIEHTETLKDASAQTAYWFMSDECRRDIIEPWQRKLAEGKPAQVERC